MHTEYIYIHLNILCTHLGIHTDLHFCKYTHTFAYMRIYPYILPIFMNSYLQIYIDTYLHIYMCAYLTIDIYTYMHTHTIFNIYINA